MWGNRKGWMIAAVMVALYAGLLWVIASAGRTTPPTKWSQAAIVQKPVALPTPPGSVVPMTEPGDAGSLYRQAIADYERNRKTYDDFLAGKAKTLDHDLPGLKAVRDATNLLPGAVFADSPEHAIRWTTDAPKLEAIDQVGKAATLLGMREMSTNRDASLAHLRAAFALGAKLYDERLSYAQMSKGLGLMSGAASQLAKHADAADKPQYEKFLADYETYSRQLYEVQKVISSLPVEGRRDPYAGDMMLLAQSPQVDRVWRVEAALKLGRYRFHAPTAGDQRGANRVLKEIAAKEQDPAVKKAVDMALALTLNDYKKLGG